MKSFKKLINKIIKENEKINLYNSVISENLKNIKELFEPNNLNVSIHRQENGSVTLQIDDGCEGSWFDYEKVLKNNHLFVKPFIEKSLKSFIINKVKNCNVQIVK